MPSPFATWASWAVAARTCETLPAADSISGWCIVWMLSMMTNRGLSAWIVAAIWVTSVSLCSSRSPPVIPSRSARNLICVADSSPET